MNRVSKIVKSVLLLALVSTTITGCGSVGNSSVEVLNENSVTVTFEGYDGLGSMDAEFNISGVDYLDKENAGDYELALINTYLSHDYSNTLSNGDVVTITAKYDEELAEEYELELTGTTYDVTVEGLTEVYRTAEELPEEMKTSMRETADKAAQEKYGSSATYDSMYLAVYNYDDGTKGLSACVVVYKVSREGWADQFYYVEIGPATADYSEEDNDISFAYVMEAEPDEYGGYYVVSDSEDVYDGLAANDFENCDIISLD